MNKLNVVKISPYPPVHFLANAVDHHGLITTTNMVLTY